ncbi:MAG: hypothetical protein GY880_20880 [Planctomycetaceae bacterium]|nr:hypothetical protein [Planctomycetaceae bacterium]
MTAEKAAKPISAGFHESANAEKTLVWGHCDYIEQEEERLYLGQTTGLRQPWLPVPSRCDPLWATDGAVLPVGPRKPMEHRVPVVQSSRGSRANALLPEKARASSSSAGLGNPPPDVILAADVGWMFPVILHVYPTVVFDSVESSLHLR